jgi:putative transposase
MAYPPRILEPNLTYHTHSRCANCENRMSTKHMKDLLIRVVSQAQKKYTFQLMAFEILDNHFHFLIRTKEDGETVAKIMQFIKSVYAKRFNKLTERKGPFWNERYGSKIVEQAKNPTHYLLYLLWYLAYNSCRKGYVTDPRYYAYGSINYYLQKDYQGKLKITLPEAFLNLGNTWEERLTHFLLYEEYYLLYLSEE